MYISIPITIFCFTLGFISGVLGTILFGNYLVKKQEKEAIEKSRRIMQDIVDRVEKDKDKDKEKDKE